MFKGYLGTSDNVYLGSMISIYLNLYFYIAGQWTQAILDDWSIVIPHLSDCYTTYLVSLYIPMSFLVRQ